MIKGLNEDDITYRWVKITLPSSKPRSTLTSFFVCAAISGLGSNTESPLPDSTHFAKPESHTAPPEDR